MVNINSLERDGLRQAELCPRHTMMMNTKKGMDFASSTRAAENRSRWKGIVANSSVVPRQPPKVMG